MERGSLQVLNVELFKDNMTRETVSSKQLFLEDEDWIRRPFRVRV